MNDKSSAYICSRSNIPSLGEAWRARLPNSFANTPLFSGAGRCACGGFCVYAASACCSFGICVPLSGWRIRKPEIDPPGPTHKGNARLLARQIEKSDPLDILILAHVAFCTHSGDHSRMVA